RSAMDLRQAAHGALGPLRPARGAAEIRRGRVPDGVVVGRRARRQDWTAVVTDSRLPPAITFQRGRDAGPSRREALRMGAGALGAAAGLGSGALTAPARADDVEAHGISAFGDLKYPADFHHFDYVDPSAPKGGVFSQAVTSRGYNGSFLTFNSLNAFTLKGDGAVGMGGTFGTLLARAEDEPDAMYGLAARAVRISPDKLTYRFLLRPQARFHDGSPITGHDVAFSLNVLKEKGHPLITQVLRDFKGAEAADDAGVIVRFAENRAPDIPLFVAGLPIFSRAYYETRPFDETSLDVPLGSGAYKVGRFEAGRYIEYERVKDWWGGELPVTRGQGNFDALR